MNGAVQKQEEHLQRIKKRDWELVEFDDEALVRTIKVLFVSWIRKYTWPTTPIKVDIKFILFLFSR